MARLNYTSRDYPAILAELRVRAQELFSDWTDFNEGNAGNAILGALALVGDILNANQDAQFSETFWDSARHRKSIISQAKAMGYRLASARPSTVTIQATIPATAGGVTIPKRTQVMSAGLTPVRIFELQTDLTIPAGQTTGQATARHAETKEDQFAANGTNDQHFVLTYRPYLDGTAQVTVDGATWSEVENFVGSTAADLHYTVKVDEHDLATIVFGDGALGARPTGEVVVRYEIGGGVIGNVPSNTLKVLDGAFTDSLGAGIQVTVTNPGAATGGEERESIERARKLAPHTQKASSRTVSREDFERNALIDGVIRAKAVTRDEWAGLAANQTGVFIMPTGGGEPSLELRDTVKRELVQNKPIQLGWDVIALVPTYRAIDVDVRITPQRDVDREQLKAEAEAAIQRWFDPERTEAIEDDPWKDKSNWTGASAYAITWGMTVHQSRLMAVLFRDPANRVFSVSINLPVGDVVCGPLEFPTLGTLTVGVN